jgi:hypothetical protein
MDIIQLPCKGKGNVSKDTGILRGMVVQKWHLFHISECFQYQKLVVHPETNSSQMVEIAFKVFNSRNTVPEEEKIEKTI